MPIKIIVLTEYNPHHSWLGLTEQQNLTLFRGRAWMPEVERPKALQDAKPTERSLKGKGVGDFQGIVRFFGRAGVGREVGVTIPPS